MELIQSTGIQAHFLVLMFVHSMATCLNEAAAIEISKKIRNTYIFASSCVYNGLTLVDL